jgi:hypothetical protein
MKYKKTIIIALFFIAIPGITMAAGLANPLGTTDLRQVIGKVINVLLGLSGAVALLMFVWGGFQWLISGGNAKRVESGKNTLIWASIGLVVCFTAYMLVNMLISALTSGTAS